MVMTGREILLYLGVLLSLFPGKICDKNQFIKTVESVLVGTVGPETWSAVCQRRQEEY